MSQPLVICVLGPTASGKSALAERIARDYPVELVSVDSAQIYRGLDIGSAKPDLSIRRAVPYHLIDIRDPADPYTVGDFCRDCLAAIDDIHGRGRVALLVGGTMMYFKHFFGGLARLPVSDPTLRERLRQRAHQHGWQRLHDELAAVDPVAAERIHVNDPQRLLRALEVFQSSGRPLSELQAQTVTPEHRFQTRFVTLWPSDRALLHERIEWRFRSMLRQGLMGEVQALFGRRDLHPGLPALRAVGYRQMWDFLSGNLRYDEMESRAIIATRQLAKRQLTWLRAWPHEQLRLDSDSMDLDRVVRDNIHSLLVSSTRP